LAGGDHQSPIICSKVLTITAEAPEVQLQKFAKVYNSGFGSKPSKLKEFFQLVSLPGYHLAKSRHLLSGFENRGCSAPGMIELLSENHCQAPHWAPILRGACETSCYRSNFGLARRDSLYRNSTLDELLVTQLIY
jgi:hypothetical protein